MFSEPITSRHFYLVSYKLLYCCPHHAVPNEDGWWRRGWPVGGGRAGGMQGGRRMGRNMQRQPTRATGMAGKTGGAKMGGKAAGGRPARAAGGKSQSSRVVE
eukprot:sb/3478418/